LVFLEWSPFIAFAVPAASPPPSPCSAVVGIRTTIATSRTTHRRFRFRQTLRQCVRNPLSTNDLKPRSGSLDRYTVPQ
jgi:hypothetical protein